MIEAANLFKKYGEKVILRDLTFSIPEGRIFGLIGPSGSGKSTLLRLLDLIEMPTAGTLAILGEDALSGDARFRLRRRMAMLSQKPVIFNLDVYENIAMGMRYRKEGAVAIESQVKEALREIGLADYARRSARTLSGGEAQRVALARALVTDPEILFLDEPTANLDPLSAGKIEEIILRLNRERGMTIVLSTHDMLQGQRLCQDLGILMAGRLQQAGPTREIFRKPANKDVARFVMVDNILGGMVTGNRNGEITVDISGKGFLALADVPPGKKVDLLFRPEDVTLELARGARSSARNAFPGTITRILAARPLVQVTVDCGVEIRALVTASSAEDLGLSEGKEVRLSVKATAIHVLPREE